MNIAEFSVKRPVAITMRIASLVLLGAICATMLPIDLLPKVSLPTVAVVTTWPNVAPEEMETQITRPVERAVSSAQGLYQVTSSSIEGNSMVRIQFNWATDMGQAAVDVLQLVQRAQRNFPNDPTLQMPVVFKADPTQAPILIYGVSGEKDPVKLRMLMDNQVAPIIESANGVSSATVTGGLSRSVIVDVDSARLRAYHLTLSAISTRIGQENSNLPAGIARQGNTEYTIRSLGWFTSSKEIGTIPVGSFNGRIVSLSDVANVHDDHAETRLYTRLNGQPAVGLIISKQSGANTVATAQAVQAKIAQAQKLYPNLRFGLAYDQAHFIRDSINDVTNNALIGGALAVVILLFFLRNIRSTLVVALSIPISIISTFGLLYMCGFTLNTMSLSGLALATGLIVDDAVVVLENIFRHIERDGKPARLAAVSGTMEMASAVVASTMTIMVVFLPLLLIKGQAGQMFTQFALVVIFSIAMSLLDATTVVPMLASRLISGEAHHENMANGGKRNLLDRMFYGFGAWFNRLDASYRNGLDWAIHHRMYVVIGAVAVTLGGLSLVPLLGTELMPSTDSGDFTVGVKMPIGTALETTDRTMHQVEQIIGSNPNVKTVFSAAGTTLSMRGSTTTALPHVGSATVKLKDDRKQSTLEVMTDLRRKLARLPGVQARPNQVDVVSSMMTGGNQSLEIDIFGNDLQQLSSLGKEVMSRVRGVTGFENVDVNWQDATPEIQWKVDRQKAQQLGLDFTDIANTINTATSGTIASYYQEGGFQYPIQVQVMEPQRKTVAGLETLPVRPSTSTEGSGGSVLLQQVASPTYATGPSEITRQDRQRYIAVTGQPQGRSEGEIQKDIQTALKDLHMPSGYYWDWGTDQKRRADEFSGMNLAVFLAIGLIYMLLASQFESFIHPLTILVSVPLSALGVVLALFLTNRSFGLTAFIGLLMLVGIVVKNGILLVDYTNTLRGRGIPRTDAVLTAGPTRLRPILMTTSATVLGMLPIAMGIGKGSEMNAPMATAVIGGLLASTFLTLFVVPTVYTIFDDLAIRFNHGQSSVSSAKYMVEPVEIISGNGAGKQQHSSQPAGKDE